jgi:hypothetical protein
MSEFKFACPVCGQHMMCDSSQAGTAMDCPTCFQKIVAPQAPAPDAKFILTGTMLTEKKIPARGVAGPTAMTQKKFPVALVFGLILLCLAAAFIYRGPIFRFQPAPPEKPALVAPHASDTNWMLTLGTTAIPDAPAAGRIHGQDFIVEHASFQNGALTLRAGTGGLLEFGVQINFSGALAESLAGKSLNILAVTNKSARVTLRWKDESGAVQSQSYEDNYALRLEFGMLANDQLPGKIYLCTPDAKKSYLLGSFNADVINPNPSNQ